MQCLQVYEGIVRHVDWEVVRCLVIAGPGFTKDSFRGFLDAEAVRQDNRYLAKLVVHLAESCLRCNCRALLLVCWLAAAVYNPLHGQALSSVCQHFIYASFSTAWVSMCVAYHMLWQRALPRPAIWSIKIT